MWCRSDGSRGVETPRWGPSAGRAGHVKTLRPPALPSPPGRPARSAPQRGVSTPRLPSPVRHSNESDHSTKKLCRAKLLDLPFLIVLFIALLGSVAWLNRGTTTGRRPFPARTCWTRYGFRLEEVAKSSGIDFTHQAPTLDPKLAHIMPQVASMGAAVSVGDFDRDGWPDLYVTNSGEGSQNRLYRNLHDGTFEDVAEAMGVADVNQRRHGRLDGRGLGRLRQRRLRGPASSTSGAGPSCSTTTAARASPASPTRPGCRRGSTPTAPIWLDYDRDGQLDLFLGGYWAEKLDLWHLKNTQMMPESFEYAKNGGRKYLLRNRGDGTFEDVTEKVGLDSHRWTLAAAAADLRGTGYPDLFLANDYGVSELFANQGGKSFREIGKATGDRLRPQERHERRVRRRLQPGPVRHLRHEHLRGGRPDPGQQPLGARRRGPRATTLQYENLAERAGRRAGRLELRRAVRRPEQRRLLGPGPDQRLRLGRPQTRATGTTSRKIAGGNSAIIADAKNWPPMQGRSLSGYQQKQRLAQRRRGPVHRRGPGRRLRPTPTTAARSRWPTSGTAACWTSSSPTRRGRCCSTRTRSTPDEPLDRVRAGRHEEQPQRHRRRRSGSSGTARQQVQEVSGGSGFCAQNQRRLHFGLGKTPKVEKAVDPLALRARCRRSRPRAVDQVHHVEEPAMITTDHDAVPDAAAGRRPRRRRRLLTLRQPLPRAAARSRDPARRPAHASASWRATRRRCWRSSAASSTELILGRLVDGKWPHLASAYITGISVGILVRSPAFWPYALCSLISITSKYAIRWRGPAPLEPVELRHLRDALPGARDASPA